MKQRMEDLMRFIVSRIKSLVSKKLAVAGGGTVLLEGMAASPWHYVVLWAVYIAAQTILDWQAMKMGTEAPSLPEPQPPVKA